MTGGVHASFLHTHPAGTPEAVARFARAAAGGPHRDALTAQHRT